MPVDNPRSPGDYPVWMHTAIREASKAPDTWFWGATFPTPRETRNALRRARAFRKALKLRPGHPTAYWVPAGHEIRFRLDGMTIEVCIRKPDPIDQEAYLNTLANVFEK